MEEKLNFYGYYYFFDKEENAIDSVNCVLRFFKDTKKVISVSIGQNLYEKYKPIESFTLNSFFPNDSWFNESYQDYGIYEISGNHIEFKCGFVSYKGTILENGLELSSHSDANGHEAHRNYRFISFEELKYKKINLLDYLAANS